MESPEAGVVFASEIVGAVVATGRVETSWLEDKRPTKT